MVMENPLSDLLNLPAGGGETTPPRHPPWKILIVDDEGDIHSVTKLVLADFTFRDRGLAFIDAYSGYSACKIMEEHPDTAVILLDVVMESRDAALQVIKHIRNQLKNARVRIILRTGQPGEAPEQNVIVNYDINDYKCKTELTAQKLFSSLITALRSYEDIAAAGYNSFGLRQALEALPLSATGSREQFLSGALMQAGALLGAAGRDLLLLRRDGEDGYTLVAALGKNATYAGQDAAALFDAATLAELRRTGCPGVFVAAHGVFLVPSADTAIYVEGEVEFKETEWLSVAKYCDKVCQAIFSGALDGGFSFPR